jgi:hypothetical protein
MVCIAAQDAESLTSAIRRNRFALTVCCQIRKDGPHQKKPNSRNSVVAIGNQQQTEKRFKKLCFHCLGHFIRGR